MKRKGNSVPHQKTAFFKPPFLFFFPKTNDFKNYNIPSLRIALEMLPNYLKAKKRVISGIAARMTINFKDITINFFHLSTILLRYSNHMD